MPPRFLLALLLPWLLLAACGRKASGPDVLLVILDTVRADHLSSYGYPRETTPNLDRIAGEGERYTRAYGQSPWTLPAVATILTGQPPHVHGASLEGDQVFSIHGNVKTLGRRMADARYRTAAFFSVVWCDPGSGLADGFERYDFRESDDTNRGHRVAEETTNAAIAWLAEAGEDPFFLVVHYFDPHLTYDPPTPFDVLFEPDTLDRIAPGFGSAKEVNAIRSGAIRLSPREQQSLVARYDGEIAYMDRQIGKLRAALERAGRWEKLVALVVADHGEEFADHGGFEHGHTHYRELLHVPLILKNPGGPRGVVRRELVRQLDVAPTLCRLAGIPVPPELPGIVLGTAGAPFSVAEGTLWGGDLVSVRSDLGTLIRNRTTGATLFFAPEDVFEKTPIPAGSEARRRLEAVATALPAGRSLSAEPWNPSPEQMEQLRSLGYIK